MVDDKAVLFRVTTLPRTMLEDGDMALAELEGDLVGVAIEMV